MNRTLFSMVMILCTAALLVGVQTTNADLITKDSADFQWKYEMDVDPAGQDLDDNSVMDWSLLRGTPSFTDGILTMGSDGNLFTCYLSNANADNSIWSNISHTTGFTFELKLQTAGTRVWNTYHGGLYVRASDTNDAEKLSDLIPINEKTLWDNTSRVVLDEDDNNDDFHVFRIAQEANSSEYYVWLDGDLLYKGLGLQTKGGAAMKNRLQFGDMGGAGGPNEVDYARLTVGAFAPAPIPEPSTLALLATGLIGLLAYAWRKRK